MLELALKYFLFIFLASLGVLQIAASYANLRGLSFFNRPAWGYIFGLLMVAAGFCWFYTMANPHPDVAYAITLVDIFRYGWSNPKPAGIGLIMGEAECLFFFLLAALCAFVTTILISSIVKSRQTGGEMEEGASGLEAFRGMTLFQALTRRRDRGDKE